ncbi:MAG: hypothetical protein ACE37J_12255 [Pikeienuella sp.]|uniref:hypothetical protein n=1 Tax=Pikeienuella sp. TaxID=2831957 RepID=UPI0039189142
MTEDPDRITIRLAPHDRQLLQRLAAAEDRSLSSLIRVLIRNEAASRGILTGRDPVRPRVVADRPD